MPEHNKTKDVLIGIMTIAMVVIGIVVYQTGYKSSPKTGVVSQTQNIPPIPPTEVHRVFGTVEKVSGQEITLKDFKKLANIGDISSGQSERMVVIVDQSTIIERFIRKDIMVFAKELEAFGKEQAQGAQSTSTPPAPPEPFTLEKITLSDIKVGDSIVASSAVDISKLTTFMATKIEIQK